jgi:hypothetical protein
MAAGNHFSYEQAIQRQIPSHPYINGKRRMQIVPIARSEPDPRRIARAFITLANQETLKKVE